MLLSIIHYVLAETYTNHSSMYEAKLLIVSNMLRTESTGFKCPYFTTLYSFISIFKSFIACLNSSFRSFLMLSVNHLKNK